jgi:hypothetical protein
MRGRLAWLVWLAAVASCGRVELWGARPDAGPVRADATTVDLAAVTAADAADAADARDGADAVDARDGADAVEATDATDAPSVVLFRDVNLTTARLTEGRTCAEGPQYAVAALAGATASLAEIPMGDCLAAGDEVMLLNAQGTPADFARVGTWELMRVASVAAQAVTFTAAVTRDFGSPEAGQKLLLARVPRFDELRVLSGTVLRSAPWNGTTGGLLVLRARSLRIDGDVSAATMGYRQGRWSQGTASFTDGILTEAGESVSGEGVSSTDRNVGGSGGIDPAVGASHRNDTPISSSPGHAQPGEAGLDTAGHTLGQPGAAYGVADGSRLTMGSGPGGNLTCANDIMAPRLVPQTQRSAGIVALFVDTLVVGPEGVIYATPPEQSRGVAFAGGYVFIRGRHLDLREGRVTAKGSRSRSGGPTTANMFNRGGDGYVVLDATGTIAGTTDPPANVLQH